MVQNHKLTLVQLTLSGLNALKQSQGCGMNFWMLSVSREHIQRFPLQLTAVCIMTVAGTWKNSRMNMTKVSPDSPGHWYNQWSTFSSNKLLQQAWNHPVIFWLYLSRLKKRKLVSNLNATLAMSNLKRGDCSSSKNQACKQAFWPC